MASFSIRDHLGSMSAGGTIRPQISFAGMTPIIEFAITDLRSGAKASVSITLDEWIELIKRVPHVLSEKVADNG